MKCHDKIYHVKYVQDRDFVKPSEFIIIVIQTDQRIKLPCCFSQVNDYIRQTVKLISIALNLPGSQNETIFNTLRVGLYLYS